MGGVPAEEELTGALLKIEALARCPNVCRELGVFEPGRSTGIVLMARDYMYLNQA